MYKKIKKHSCSEDFSNTYKATTTTVNVLSTLSRVLPNLGSRINYLYGFESTCESPMAVTLL